MRLSYFSLQYSGRASRSQSLWVRFAPWRLDMSLLISLVVYTLVVMVAAQALPGVKLEKGAGPAVGLSLVFGVLNILIGWIIKVVLGIAATAITVLTLGLGWPVFFLVGTTANAVLLRFADSLLPGFELDGWAPAFVMGFLLGMASWALGAFGS